MGKNKRRAGRKVQAQMRQQPVTAAMPHRLPAPATVREYYNSMSAEEQKEAHTVIDVARHAGVVTRLENLLKVFFLAHNVQSLLWGEMEKLTDTWGLTAVKGVRPAINSLQRSEDVFFRTISSLFMGGVPPYASSVDNLYDRVMRWAALPKAWKPGDCQRLEGEAMVEDIAASLKDGRLQLKEQDLKPEPKGECRTLYAIAEGDGSEGATVVRHDIVNKGLAVAQAKSMARKSPDRIFVAYEQRTQLVETCHMTPFKAVRQPVETGSDMVVVDVRPKGQT